MRHVMTHRYTVSPTSFPRVRRLGMVDDSPQSVAEFIARSVNRPHIAVPPMHSVASVVTL
jgi:hypothetical protein